MKLKEFDFDSIPKTSPVAPGRDVTLVIDADTDMWYMGSDFKNVFDGLPCSYPDREIEYTYWIFERFVIKLI